MKRVLLSLAALAAAHLYAAESATFQVGRFTFERPAGWTSGTPASPMRKAELLPPPMKAGEPKCEVTFFHFGPGQGGSVESNVQRWVGQFEGGAEKSNAMRRELTHGRTNVTLVTATGTFQSGMPGGSTTPMPNFMLYGAILQSSEGDVYIKMTGPEATVKAAVPAFEAMMKKACE
jgi:hypothetical protein